MTAFDDVMRLADTDIFDAVGGQGVLQDEVGRRYIVQCVIEPDVDVMDDFGKVIAKRDYADIIVPPRVIPARGWRIDVDSTTWILDMPQASDGNVQTWSLRQ